MNRLHSYSIKDTQNLDHLDLDRGLILNYSEFCLKSLISLIFVHIMFFIKRYVYIHCFSPKSFVVISDHKGSATGGFIHSLKSKSSGEQECHFIAICCYILCRTMTFWHVCVCERPRGKVRRLPKTFRFFLWRLNIYSESE